MRNITIRHLFSLLLACVLLAQAAVSAADWHVDLPATTPNSQSVHCAAMAVIQHHITHHAGQQDSVGEHHHQCCHSTAGSVAVPTSAVSLPLTQLGVVIPPFAFYPYRNPHADLLIRPPIA